MRVYSYHLKGEMQEEVLFLQARRLDLRNGL